MTPTAWNSQPTVNVKAGRRRRSPWTPLPWVLVKDGKVALSPVDPFHNGELLPHEVVISHPDFPATQDLGLRWYAVPILADMALKIGGVVYPFAPFNGHYLGTEIAARNLTDPDRYNALKPWAEACGISIKAKRALWQDEALVRLNQALLASFDAAGVTVGDHHELDVHLSSGVTPSKTRGVMCLVTGRG